MTPICPGANQNGQTARAEVLLRRVSQPSTGLGNESLSDGVIIANGQDEGKRNQVREKIGSSVESVRDFFCHESHEWKRIKT